MDFGVLGPLEVRADGKRLALGGPKQRALLAILLLSADRVVSRDRLIDELWADDPPAAARHALDVNVSRLRKALGANSNGDSVLVTRAPGYVLSVAAGELDLWRFERLVEDGRQALEAGDPDAAARSLREAERLWRGRPLADLEFEPFARVEVERLEELRLAAAEERVEADLALGRHGRLVAELEALAAEHPLRERLRAQLMLALYRCGRQADALEAYRRSRAALVEQIGVEPGPELRALHEAILRQDPALEAPRPLELPEELETTSPLVGREAELERLRAAWERARGGRGTVAAVSGPPGIGRTRLVAELAGEVHRQGAPVLCGVDALVRARVAKRPTLAVLDDLDDDAAVALAEAAPELASRPLLLVAITADAALIERLSDVEHLALGPLGADAIGAIAALYAPGDSEFPVADLAERSGGVPQRAHRLAAELARTRAARRLRPVAHRTATERSDLRRAELELEAGVAELQAVRERAELHEVDVAATACPFRGLSAFDVGDAEFFFGRERLVAEMVARLAGAPLLGVVGPSGSGKSSAVRAGLLAALAGGALPGSEGWAQVLIRPGEHPAATLERAIAAQRLPERTLVAVDQFEETFTLCRDEGERAAFIDALVAMATDGGRHTAVVLAARADFYGRCAVYPHLVRLLGANHVLVGPMQRDELRRAIEHPALRAHLHVEPGLVDRLLADVEGQPGALPLLSTALVELWQRRDGRRLRLIGYELSGGVSGAVARLAEAAFDRLDAEQQAVARRILLRLAGEDVGGAPVRRRVALDELDAHRDGDARRVLGVLADGRLVTLSDETAEVAHEALLREWPRLRGWIEEDADGRRLHHQLAGAARDWEVGGRDAGELYRGARLAGTLDWSAAHAADLNAAERAFLEASRAENEREARVTRRTNRRLRGLLAGVAALLVLAGAAGMLFLDQRGTARDEARIAEAQRLGAQALVEDDLDRSLLLARQGVALDDSLQTRGNLLAALMRSPAAIAVARVGDTRLGGIALRPDGRVLVVGDEHGEVRFLDPVTHRPTRPPYATHTAYIRALVFSPDGSRLAAGGFGAIHLLDGRTFRRITSLDLPGHDIQFINVLFSPDGRELVAMYEKAAGGRPPQRVRATLLRFDARTGRRIGSASIVEQGSLADFAAFAPDGRWLLTAMRATALFPGQNARSVLHGRGIVLRDPRTLRPLRSFPATAVMGALSPDGRTIAAGGADGSVRLLDLGSGRVRTASGRHGAMVRGAQFTPDGRLLATAGDDAKVIVWDVKAATAVETLAGHAGPVIGLAIDRGARRLDTAAADGTVITWDLAGDERLGRPFDAGRTSGDWFLETTISPDGRSLAMQQADGTVSLVDLATLGRRAVAIEGVREHAATAYAPAFGPDGTLAVSGVDGLLALADARTGRIVARLRGHRDLVFSPTVSADRRILASTGEDGTLRLWSTRPVRLLGAPIRLDGGAAGHAAISPDGTKVAVSVFAGTVDVFDVRSRRRLARLRIDESFPTFAGFSGDGRLLLTGSQAGHVRLFSTHDLRPLGPAFLAQAGSVSSVDTSPDGRTLVTTGTDGQVRLWDVATRRPIGTPLPGPENINAVAHFAPDGYLYVVFATGRGYRWDVRPSSWERHACTVAGRRLTPAEWGEALPGRPYKPAC
jgi:WD40 repeat protein/DNA-binding SARP family transcriptional activator